MKTESGGNPLIFPAASHLHFNLPEQCLLQVLLSYHLSFYKTWLYSAIKDNTGSQDKTRQGVLFTPIWVC